MYEAPIDIDIFMENLKYMMPILPKLRSKLVKIYGDYYYSQISIDGTLKKTVVINRD